MIVVSCLLLCGIKFALCELGRPPIWRVWEQSLRTCVPGACTPLTRCNTLDFVPKSVCQGAQPLWNSCGACTHVRREPAKSLLYRLKIKPVIVVNDSQSILRRKQPRYFLIMVYSRAILQWQGGSKMDSQKFGTFIAQCRKDKKMTQSDLAAKLNVTDKAISRWERGVSHS